MSFSEILSAKLKGHKIQYLNGWSGDTAILTVTDIRTALGDRVIITSFDKSDTVIELNIDEADAKSLVENGHFEKFLGLMMGNQKLFTTARILTDNY